MSSFSVETVQKTDFVPFELGRIVATPAITEIDAEWLDYLQKHAQGDWGVICEDDKQVNNQNTQFGGMLLSAYIVSGQRVWVITESDRSVTTIMLPDER